jgi:hypothetical protein
VSRDEATNLYEILAEETIADEIWVIYSRIALIEFS